MIVAVVRELERTHALAIPDRQKEVPAGADPEAAFGYYADLLDIARKSDDPIVIPQLILAMDVGPAVTNKLASLGESVVPQVLAEVERHDEAGYLISAMGLLRMIVDRNPNLSPPLKAGIGSLVRQRLTGRQHSVVVRRAIEVASVLRDPRASAMVAAIETASAPAAAGLTLLDTTANFDILREYATRARAADPSRGVRGGQ